MILRIVMIFFISQIFTSGAIYASENNLFSIDKWEGAGGDTFFTMSILMLNNPESKFLAEFSMKWMS